jgi:hypothetical protein
MTPNTLPKIELKSSPEAEVGLFLKFLHHDFHKQQKNIILNSFPELKNDLDNIGDRKEEDIIKNFVLNFYDQNTNKITSIIENDTQSLSQKGETILNALGNLMDDDWFERTTFYATPTILPFSPFEEDTFYYSILGKIRNSSTQKNVLYIAAHEISHFIFYDTLKSLAIPNTLSKEGEHYLKEALAPAVLNEEPLKEILELENYSGNPELHGLNLSVNGENIGFTEFISSYYHKHKIIDKENFSSILFALIDIMSTIDEELIAKKEIWNKYGMKMNENSEALENYKKPILLVLK